MDLLHVFARGAAAPGVTAHALPVGANKLRHVAEQLPTLPVNAVAVACEDGVGLDPVHVLAVAAGMVHDVCDAAFIRRCGPSVDVRGWIVRPTAGGLALLRRIVRVMEEQAAPESTAVTDVLRRCPAGVRWTFVSVDVFVTPASAEEPADAVAVPTEEAAYPEEPPVPADEPAEEPVGPVEVPAEEPEDPVEVPAEDPAEEPPVAAEEPAVPVAVPVEAPAEEPPVAAEEPPAPVEAPAKGPADPAEETEDPGAPAETPQAPKEPPAEEPPAPAQQHPAPTLLDVAVGALNVRVGADGLSVDLGGLKPAPVSSAQIRPARGTRPASHSQAPVGSPPARGGWGSCCGFTSPS